MSALPPNGDAMSFRSTVSKAVARVEGRSIGFVPVPSIDAQINALERRVYDFITLFESTEHENDIEESDKEKHVIDAFDGPQASFLVAFSKVLNDIYGVYRFARLRDELEMTKEEVKNWYVSIQDLFPKLMDVQRLLCEIILRKTTNISSVFDHLATFIERLGRTFIRLMNTFIVNCSNERDDEGKLIFGEQRLKRVEEWGEELNGSRRDFGDNVQDVIYENAESDEDVVMIMNKIREMKIKVMGIVQEVWAQGDGSIDWLALIIDHEISHIDELMIDLVEALPITVDCVCTDTLVFLRKLWALAHSINDGRDRSQIGLLIVDFVISESGKTRSVGIGSIAGVVKTAVDIMDFVTLNEIIDIARERFGQSVSDIEYLRKMERDFVEKIAGLEEFGGLKAEYVDLSKRTDAAMMELAESLRICCNTKAAFRRVFGGTKDKEAYDRMERNFILFLTFQNQMSEQWWEQIRVLERMISGDEEEDAASVCTSDVASRCSRMTMSVSSRSVVGRKLSSRPMTPSESMQKSYAEKCVVRSYGHLVSAVRNLVMSAILEGRGEVADTIQRDLVKKQKEYCMRIERLRQSCVASMDTEGVHEAELRLGAYKLERNVSIRKCVIESFREAIDENVRLYYREVDKIVDAFHENKDVVSERYEARFAERDECEDMPAIVLIESRRRVELAREKSRAYSAVEGLRTEMKSLLNGKRFNEARNMRAKIKMTEKDERQRRFVMVNKRFDKLLDGEMIVQMRELKRLETAFEEELACLKQKLEQRVAEEKVFLTSRLQVEKRVHVETNSRMNPGEVQERKKFAHDLDLIWSGVARRENLVDITLK